MKQIVFWIIVHISFLSCTVTSYNLSVLDAYVSYGAQTGAYIPNITIDSLNPYYGNISHFELHDQATIEIPVYDLNKNIIRYINEVYVECYDENDCDYTLTQLDVNYLSLYASYIENSGISKMNSNYALGLLRNKNYQNVMGMYTLDYQVLNNYIGFWIRLQRYGKHVYNGKEGYGRSLAVLEMAIHERSHHDAPTFSDGKAHCDDFQVNYNTLIQRSTNEMQKYHDLSLFILNNEETNNFPWDITLGIVGSFIVVSACLQVLYTK